MNGRIKHSAAAGAGGSVITIGALFALLQFLHVDEMPTKDETKAIVISALAESKQMGDIKADIASLRADLGTVKDQVTGLVQEVGYLRGWIDAQQGEDE